MAIFRQYPELQKQGWVVDNLPSKARGGSLVFVERSAGDIQAVILADIIEGPYGRVGTIDYARTGYYRKNGTRRPLRKSERAKRAKAAR